MAKRNLVVPTLEQIQVIEVKKADILKQFGLPVDIEGRRFTFYSYDDSSTDLARRTGIVLGTSLMMPFNDEDTGLIGELIEIRLYVNIPQWRERQLRYIGRKRNHKLLNLCDYAVEVSDGTPRDYGLDIAGYLLVH